MWCRFLLLGAAAVAAARGQAVQAPFDFLHNQIVLQVAVNGRGPYSFVLDSGTHATTIDAGLARRLRLPVAGPPQQGQGAGSRTVRGRATRCSELRLGNLVVKDPPAVAMDLSGVSKTMGRPLAGVLGFGFLGTRIVQIDYFHRRLRFYEESPFAPASSLPDSDRRISFPMRLLAGTVLPVLDDCYINGTRLSITLDTGSSLGLILFPNAIRRLGLEDLARAGIPLDAAGYRGRAQLTKGWVKSVVLRTIDLGAIEVAYVQQGYGETESTERRGGNLGNGVLQDFVVTLDYVNRSVVLERSEQ